MKVFFFPLIAAMVMVSGCSRTPPLETTPYLTVVERDTLPPPTLADQSDLSRPYVLGPGDKLSVDVYGLPELSRTVQIDPSGRVALPVAGAIMVAGTSTEQAERTISGKLRLGYVRNPQVAVNIIEAVSQRITVDGEVNQPGSYPAAGKLTLLRAIALAGGMGEFAKQSHVVVFRELGGKRYAALYDLRAVRQGYYLDPEIYPNDVINVGTNQARRVFRDVLQASPLISAPIIALLN